MYIAAQLKNFEEGSLKECKRIPAIGRYDCTSLLTALSFDSEKQSLNETCNLAASAIFYGIPRSLLQYSDNSIMVCGYYKAIIVDADKMN